MKTLLPKSGALMAALALLSPAILCDDPRTDSFPFLRPLAIPDSPVPAFKNGFRIEGDQTIVIFGGANAAECQRNGWLETRFITAHPRSAIRLRNLAWTGDTVHQQWRPRNFFGAKDPDYGEKDGRDPIVADIVFLWFGQMESLRGKAGLAEFKTAYEAVIGAVSKHTRRIVLVTPVPFEDPLELGLEVAKRNENLALYVAAIREIARKKQLPVVDLSAEPKDGKAKTTDGVLLSEAGHEMVALSVARQLGFDEKLPPNAGYIREAIREKNALWQRYWVPTNWAFLYGNRQTQPSSREHSDPKKRWFPDEVRALLPMVEKREAEIRDKIVSK